MYQAVLIFETIAVIELRQSHVTSTSHLIIRQQVTDHDIELSFQVQFDLTNLLVYDNFVDRDAEMTQMKLSLLFSISRHERKIHVLHDLNDIGKTQLIITYARKHQETYSAILWLNDNSKDTLLQSLASFATHANINHILKLIVKIIRRSEETAKSANVVFQWLTFKENRRWLVIFDNVDRDYHADVKDSQTYDLEFFFPAVDHDSILITTRLSHLEKFGTATQVTRIDGNQALQIHTNSSRLPQSSSGNSILR